MTRLLEERYKLAVERVCLEIDQEAVVNQLRTLRFAHEAMETAAEHLDALETCSTRALADRTRRHDADMHALVRFMILKDVVFRNAVGGHETPPRETQSPQSQSP